MPCRICERLGLELQWHYHSVCPFRNPTASRSFPPPTPRVQRPTASRSFPSATPHSYQAAASSSFPPPTPHDYQPTVASASSPDSPRYLILTYVIVNNIQYPAILDTASNVSIMPDHMFSSLRNYNIVDSCTQEYISQVKGVTIPSQKINVGIKLGNSSVLNDFYICDSDINYLILGLPVLIKCHLQIDFKTGIVYQDNKFLFSFSAQNSNSRYVNFCLPHPYYVKQSILSQMNPFTHFNINDIPSQFTLRTSTNYLDLDKLTIPANFSESQKQKLIDVLGKYKNIFAQYDLDVGLINTTPITFRLTTDTPIVQKPYRTSYANNTEINRQIHELLKYNIIRPSCSAYASPILLVQKKSDITGCPTRLCIDFRKLNLITKTENSPIPLIEEILDRLGNAKMFTSLDIKHAYWHIPIAETHKDKTAFVCQQGCYEWNRMPYGLKNGPSIFNRIIPNILQKFNIQYALNYFDDIIVFSKDFQEHLQHLDHILNALKQENIKLNFNKCQFFQNEIHFLGYTIKNGTYTPSNANIEAIKKLYRPYNMKTLQSFLGSINVYHKFIPHYAQIRAPLNTLLQKNSPWQWNQEQEQSFQTLKNALMTKPILQLYDPQKPVHIFTDSSMLGVGAILKQPDKQGILHPVAYFSRKLHKYERNYAATELETLAIIAAIQRFHPYIHNIHFTLHTDHMPLKWLKTFKNPSGRIFRWSLLLTQYDFDIQHIKGSQNVEADMLSRRPITHFLNLTDIKQYQQQEDSSHNKYKTQNGLFVKTKRGFNRIYVPLKLRENLLEKVHTQFGHIGTTQMTKTIFPQYYWPNMTQDIVNYIRHCETCQINKSRDNRPIYGPLQSLPTATEPYHIFSIDTLGGLHKYGSSKHSIHLIVDHLSRYLWAFSSKSTTVDSYITCLKTIFQTHSPKLIISDRAPAFLSSRFKKFLKQHNVKHLLTSSHNPQTNAKVERLNSTIVNRLRCKYNTHSNIPWTKHLPDVDKNRLFNEEWELQYFLISSKDKMVCFLCSTVITTIEKYNAKQHYMTHLSHKYAILEGEARKTILQQLKNEKLLRQQTFNKFFQQNNNATEATYKVAYILGKRGKPFSDVEMIKECIVEVVKCLHPEKVDKYKPLPLSRGTITERQHELATNIKQQFCTHTQDY
ncbi:K02A2.6-like [Cordylochernes scorpioides]|uniref:RNA-directed DNA polymerase n=1 Tax=Cordylochernes scorpioides TaxID=51811 RepID=A0ABY6LQV5_9ARAC|nr:K02A2.6-like [Cordylochernes scorpioides]